MNGVTDEAIEKPPEAEMLRSLIAARRSCRAFLPTPVPRATIEEMLAIAQGAASWCNAQPWQLIVTEGDATDRFREALYAYVQDQDFDELNGLGPKSDFPFPARYAGIYLDRRRETGWALYESVGIRRGDREASAKQAMENFRLFGAPHAMILTAEADLGVYGAVDCGSYLANLMLAAQSLGVATIAQAALARCSVFIRDYFQIPEHRRIVCGLSFGYADKNHPANSFSTRRANIADVATFIS
ncbi:nitroreductase family protein [Flavisphingomonas formosensis]|uniref:nitroreductase family protein n=1 Tax=Flavisphingomonas formosensis TaxID=861534 RepID=UPI0012F9E54A|nr:nitroreductase family protein [Sphingomonas formosensis]